MCAIIVVVVVSILAFINYRKYKQSSRGNINYNVSQNTTSGITNQPTSTVEYHPVKSSEISDDRDNLWNELETYLICFTYYGILLNIVYLDSAIAEFFFNCNTCVFVLYVHGLCADCLHFHFIITFVLFLNKLCLIFKMQLKVFAKYVAFCVTYIYH